MSYFEALGQANLVTEIFKHNKERFGPYATFMADVMRGTETLNGADREAIALHVSAINNCHYCVGSHRAVLSELGAAEEEVAAIETGRHDEPRLQAFLDFAGKLTRAPSDVEQADITAMRNAGASDQDIEDCVGVVAVFALMNRLLDGYGIKGNAQAFSMVGKAIARGGYNQVAQILRS